MRKLIASVALVTAVAVGGLAVAAVNPLQLVSAKSVEPVQATAADTGTATAPQPLRSDRAARCSTRRSPVWSRRAPSPRHRPTRSSRQSQPPPRSTSPSTRASVPLQSAGPLRRGVLAVSAKTIDITPEGPRRRAEERQVDRPDRPGQGRRAADGHHGDRQRRRTPRSTLRSTPARSMPPGRPRSSSGCPGSPRRSSTGSPASTAATEPGDYTQP